MTALMDAVAAATSSIERLFPQGQTPDKPAYPYGAYSASWGTGVTYTLEATDGLRRGRVTLQTFGRTVDAAMNLTEAVVDLLRDSRLDVDGWETTPLRVQLDPTVIRQSDPENTGVIGVTTVLAFTASKES